jgi:DNA processing protein
MNETLFYHVIAVAGHGNYHKIKKYRGGAASWQEAHHVLHKNGVQMIDPLEAYERLNQLDVRIALAGQKEYPEALRHIPHPPFGIYIRGGDIPTAAPTIAIVGTRRASADGKKIAHHFASELAAVGCTIASGLAFGIDAAAHEGALDAIGSTVAVLAGGLDNIYPESHAALARQIIKNNGTLISEYPPGEEPFGYRFIERNRIISGISRGVLIVEAPESSGAIATARYAAEQDRELFVVPGAITAVNFKGSHALIRQGAELVTSPDDILDAYGINKRESVTMRRNGWSAEEILILKALRDTSSPADVDKLVSLTKLEPRIINKSLSLLLIRGIVKESDQGYTI